MEAYDAPLPYPTTANDPAITLDTLENGIAHAFESLVLMNKLKQALMKNANKPVSKTHIKIGLLALEHIKKSTGIFENGMIIATECFTENVSVEGIVSGIGDIMKSIWDAIKRTFAYIGEMIGNFFLGAKRPAAVKKGAEKAAEMAEEIKDIKETTSGSKVAELTTEHGAFAPFLYGESKSDIKKLMEHLGYAKKSIGDTESLVTALEIANLNIQESVTLIKKDHNDQDSYKNAFIGTGTYYTSLKGLFSANNNWHSEGPEIAHAIGVEMNTIDPHSVREVKGLTAGNRLMFCSRLMNTSNDTRYHLASIQEQPTAHAVEVIKYDIHQLSAYSDELVDVYKLLVDVARHYEQKSGKMIARQEQMLKDMEAAFNLAIGDEEEAARHQLKYFRLVTSSIMQSTKDLVTVINRLDRAVNHHKDLLAVLISYYKKAT